MTGRRLPVERSTSPSVHSRVVMGRGDSPELRPITERILDEVGAWLIVGVVMTCLVFGVPALVHMLFTGGR